MSTRSVSVLSTRVHAHGCMGMCMCMCMGARTWVQGMGAWVKVHGRGCMVMRMVANGHAEAPATIGMKRALAGKMPMKIDM